MYDDDHVSPETLLPIPPSAEPLPDDFSEEQLAPYYEAAYRGALRDGCTCTPDILLGLSECDNGHTVVSRVDVYHDDDCGVLLRQIARFN